MHQFYQDINKCFISIFLIEMIASMNRPVPVNTNRERRPRYQHPKGAPDADLIFGSKYVLGS